RGVLRDWDLGAEIWQWGFEIWNVRSRSRNRQPTTDNGPRSRVSGLGFGICSVSWDSVVSQVPRLGMRRQSRSQASLRGLQPYIATPIESAQTSSSRQYSSATTKTSQRRR